MNALALDYLASLFRRHGGKSEARRASAFAAHRERLYGEPTEDDAAALHRVMVKRHGWARGNG